MMRVAVYRGGEPDRYVDIPQGVARIGRAPENDVVLDDPTKGVSRIHAELRQDRGRWLIVDLNSQNGVWIGGRRVTREEVAAGTPIALGPFEILLEEVDGASETMAVPPPDPSGTFPPQRVNRGAPTESMGPVEPRTVEPPAGGSGSKVASPAAGSGRAIPIWPIAAVVLLILLGVGGFAWIKSMQSAAPPAAKGPSEPPAAPPPVDPKPNPPAETELQQHVRLATERLDANDLDGAAAEIDAALRLDPNSPEAAAAKTRLDAARAEIAKAVEPAVDPFALPKWPANLPKPKRAGNEPGPTYVKRANEIRKYYEDGMAAIAAGRADEALGDFAMVDNRESGYADIKAQMEKARQMQQASQQRADARRGLTDAQGLERSGEIGRAIAAYQRAFNADSSLKEASDAVARLKGVVDQRLPDLASQAKIAAAYKDSAKEAGNLEQILKLLPDTDARRAEFEKRLKELRSR